MLILIQDQPSARRAGGHGGALYSSISLIPGDTDTHHRSDRESVEYLALGISATRIRYGAWVDTLLIDAGCLAGTFFIRSATYLCSSAACSLGSLKARRTCTVDFVISYNTLGGFFTRVLNGTWTYTVVVVTGFV